MSGSISEIGIPERAAVPTMDLPAGVSAHVRAVPR